MNTREFFDLIWPSRGWRCVVFVDPREPGVLKHRWYNDNDKAAGAVRALDEAQATVYHGCASFTDKALGRKQVNACYAKAFWMDLDCGPGKPFAVKSEAAKAVLGFAQKLGLANPYLVSSGGGLHAYWVLDAELPIADWTDTASMLKAAAKEYGLPADPTRTADSASILRPVGSHHRKGEAREVTMAIPGQVTSTDAVRSALVSYLGDLAPAKSTIAGVMPAGFDVGMNSDLSGGLPEYEPRTSEPIAEKCGVVGLVRETHGNVDQPTWYGVLGVIGFAEDGDQFAHAWSSGHPQYSRVETEKKLEQARKYAPTTCAKLAESQPAICAACRFNGKIKSPIVLGAPERAPVTTVTPLSPPTTLQPAGPRDVDMPDGYAYETYEGQKAILRLVKQDPVEDGQGTLIPVPDAKIPLTFTPFYAISRLVMDGVAHVEFEAVDKDGLNPSRFVLEGGIIGKGRDAAAGALGRNEIVAAPRAGEYMDGYLKGWMQKLRDEAERVQAHQQFGWTDSADAFILGERRVVKGGIVRAVITGLAKSKAPALEPRGTVEEWAQLVDRAYNAGGQEAYQFMVVCGFAAPLMKLLNVDGGLTVFAHSEGTGTGKTTAAKVALSVWGDPKDLMLSEGKTTTNALWATIGAYNSLPVVYDELTNMQNALASDLVYSVSQGMARQRLAASGELRSNNGNWNTLLLATGNNLLSEKLALHRANAQAESARLFEFTLRPTGHLTPNEALDLFPRFDEQHGHAGAMFAQYLVENLAAVKQTLKAVQQALNAEWGIDQTERFWSALMAACLVSLTICRKLELLRFEAAPFKSWLHQRLLENRVQNKDVASDPLETIGRMLSDLWSGILITRGEGDFRTGDVAIVMEKPRGALVGRAIVPKEGPGARSNTKAVLLLSTQAVRDWANKKGVSAKELQAAAIQAGWLDKDPVRYSLGKGTVEYHQVTSHVTCWQLDPEKIESSLGVTMASQKLGVVNGGLRSAGGATH